MNMKKIKKTWNDLKEVQYDGQEVITIAAWCTACGLIGVGYVGYAACKAINLNDEYHANVLRSMATDACSVIEKLNNEKSILINIIDKTTNK